MKTNIRLSIIYEVKCEGFESSNDKLTSLIKAHWKYHKDSGGHMPSDGRVVLGNKGVVRYKRK